MQHDSRSGMWRAWPESDARAHTALSGMLGPTKPRPSRQRIRKFATVVVATLAAAALALGGTATASADTGTPDDAVDRNPEAPSPDEELPQEMQLIPEDKGVSALLAPDCSGFSIAYVDSPYAYGDGWISCASQQKELYDYTELFRSRWYGWQYRDNDSSTATHTVFVLSTSRWNCSGNTHKYRTTALHQVIDYSSNSWYTNTAHTSPQESC